MTIQVPVQPRAKQTKLVMNSSGGWKLYLTAPPVDGKAHEACIVFFAKELHIARSKVSLVSGIKSRKKVFFNLWHHLPGFSAVAGLRIKVISSYAEGETVQ